MSLPILQEKQCPIGQQNRDGHEEQHQNGAGQFPPGLARYAGLLPHVLGQNDLLFDHHLGFRRLDFLGRLGLRLRRRFWLGHHSDFAAKYCAVARGKRARRRQVAILDMLHVRQDFGPALVTQGAVLHHHLLDQPRHALGQLRVDLLRIGQVVGNLALHDLKLGTVSERQAPRRHVIQHRAQRVDIPAAVEIRLPARLLRRDVVRGPLEHLAAGAGQACSEHLRESHVGDFDGPVLVHQHIGGFDVAMDQPRLVPRVRERERNALRDQQRVFFTQPPPALQQLADRAAGDELHDQVNQVSGRTRIVDLHDTGMIELGCRPGLEMKPLNGLLIAKEIRGKNLDGDHPVQRHLARRPHRGHRARADFRDDLVSGQVWCSVHRACVPGFSCNSSARSAANIACRRRVENTIWLSPCLHRSETG